LETRAANRSALGMGFIVDPLLPLLRTAALQAVAISKIFP
jgi:hypothetical protein